MINNFFTEITEIEQLAAKHGVSMAHLCRQAGIKRDTVVKIKSGKTKSPRFMTLKALNDALKEITAVG